MILAGCSFVRSVVFRSSLVRHIGHVLGLCPKKEVRGVHASGDIATMADTQSFGNNSIVEFPTKAMCAHGHSSSVELSVSRVLGVTSPKPAGFSLVHLVPEALLLCPPIPRVVRRKMASIPSFGRSSLSRHICHVFSVSPKKEMVRSYADSVVAMMTDKKIVQNRAIIEIIAKAMGSVILFVRIKLPITTCICTASPEPTGIRFVDFVQESLFGCAHIFLQSKSPLLGGIGALYLASARRGKGQRESIYDMHPITKLCAC